MPMIEIVKAKCEHCGSGRKVINIKDFKKNFCIIASSTIQIWNGRKKCWICKKQPEVGEWWSISINIGERNRLYCPECSEIVERRLSEKEIRTEIKKEKGRYDGSNDTTALG